MCVESALGVNAEIAMEIVRRRWPDWVKTRPSLVELDPLQARRWLRGTSPKACAARYDLAVLAAADGGDDFDAASVLAWAMLPAACRVARGLADLDERIDELVAAQLWIEVRTYNWRSADATTTTPGLAPDASGSSAVRDRIAAAPMASLPSEAATRPDPALTRHHRCGFRTPSTAADRPASRSSRTPIRVRSRSWRRSMSPCWKR